MNFSIKAIIRAWLAPEHRINCPSHYWRQIISELERRGQHEHEAGAFLLGKEQYGRLEVVDVIFYDDLDSGAYSTGACVLGGDAFAKLWTRCREKQLTVIADVHTHPRAATQSPTDKVNPMVARVGHIALIIPNFATWPISEQQLGVYEYCGEHRWVDRTSPKTKSFFYTGFWS